MKKKQAVPNNLLPWIEARKRLNLSHAHVQMARELGMNPKKLDKLKPSRDERWKLPLPQFIEQLYWKTFKKERPDTILSVEQLAKSIIAKKAEKRAKKLEKKTRAISAGGAHEAQQSEEQAPSESGHDDDGVPF